MTRRTLFVWLKEFLDHYRDRRSVFSLLVFPLFGPFLFGLILVGDRLLTPALTLGIVGIETVTESETLERGFLEKSIAVKYYPDPTSGRTALETGNVSGLLILKARPLSIEAALEATSQTLTTRSQSVIYLYNERLLQREIPDTVSPSLLRLEEIQASSRNRLLRFLPMFILVTIFYSGLHIALDSTAGERERGTWETLLMCPLSSGEIIIGKWLNATTFGLIGLIIQGGGFALVLSDHLSLVRLGMAYALFLPVLWLFCSIQLWLGGISRSLKEAHIYGGILSLLPIVTSLGATFFPRWFDGWEWTPILGHVLLCHQGLSGGEFTGVTAVTCVTLLGVGGFFWMTIKGWSLNE